MFWRTHDSADAERLRHVVEASTTDLEGGRPEERRYRLRYRDNDLPVGYSSDIFVVTAGGGTYKRR